MPDADVRRSRVPRPPDRAERILDAATRLFCERGYYNVTLDDIGDAVGITGSAIYRHFANKDALLLAVNERMIDQVTESYADIDRTAQSPDERWRGLVRKTAGPSVEGLNYWLPATSELRHLPRQMVAGLQRKRAALVRVWVDAVQQNHPTRSAFEAEFMAEVGGGVGPTLLFYQPQLSRTRLADLLERFFFAAYLFPDDDESAPGLRPYDDEPPGVVIHPWDRPRRSSPRERVLSSAVPLFRRHGFSGVGIDTIGVAAGMTGPAVYRHFKNKEEILFEAMSRVVDQFASIISRALAHARSAEHALELVVRGYVELTAQDTDLMSVYWSQKFALAADQAAIVARGERSFTDDFAALLRCVRPDVSDGEARVLAYSAIGLMNGYWQAHLRISTARASDILFTMARNALLTA